MNVTYAHICDYASISREGKLSAMGIFDRIFASSLPYVHPVMYVAFDIELRPAEIGQPFGLLLKLVDIDGKSVLEVQAQGQINARAPVGEPIHVPQILPMSGIPFAAYGKYSFDIFINSDHKRAVVFDVGMPPGPGGPAGGAELPK